MRYFALKSHKYSNLKLCDISSCYDKLPNREYLKGMKTINFMLPGILKIEDILALEGL